LIEPEIIYQETNPYGAFNAFLEDDSRTIYLYLQSIHNPTWKMRAVWIQNRIPAPKSRSEKDLANGLAPILCEDEILPNSPISPLIKEDITFIWTEEGDSLAVFYKEEMICFLPPWSGIKEIVGYSKYAKIDTITANPLGDSKHGVLADRVDSSRKFWEYRADPKTWLSIQKNRLDFYESHFGKHIQYWSADGGKFPQLAICKFEPKEYSDVIFFTTIGISGQNMPTVELYLKDYLDFSKIEIIFAHKKTEENNSDTWIPHALGEIMKYPWMMGKWFGNGHTISLSRRDPSALHLNFTTIFFVENPSNKLEDKSPIHEFRTEKNELVKVLYAIPISDEEMIFAKEKGAKALIELMNTRKMFWVHDSERESYF
jgi:hypothetical protein